ncbi:hypothetical protein [Chitinimonas sp.]|uniref:hypothetical protein n=1 Tax=Chitinimonas sp. TaxID=1934313 RepID=UPI0035B437D0
MSLTAERAAVLIADTVLHGELIAHLPATEQQALTVEQLAKLTNAERELLAVFSLRLSFGRTLAMWKEALDSADVVKLH